MELNQAKPIPGFSRYGITTDGKLFNLITGKKLNTSPCVRGYHSTTLVDDNGNRRAVKRHRLVAITHINKPDISEDNLVVNHINSVPGDDWVSNLEWCTQKQNVRHWVKEGKIREAIPLEVMDAKSGEVTRYETIFQCSKDIGLERYSIQRRLEEGPEFIWPEDKRYRRGHSNLPWPPAKERNCGRARRVLLRNLRNGEVATYNRLRDLIPILGFKLPTLWKWASNPKQPVIFGLFQIQFAHQFKPWREVVDLIHDLQVDMGCMVVFVFDENWNNPVWYRSASACCKLVNLNPTALNYRLKSKGNIIFKDGKRYCYYNDLPKEKKKTIRYKVPLEGCVQRPSKATVTT